VAEISAVTPHSPDPRLGKPKPKSEIGFPYYTLEKSIEVARVLHERAGGRCARPQLASMLGYSAVKNGGFLTRLSAAKMFGLVETLGESVALTERSKRILSPVRPSDAAQAKLDAYMSVELFRRVFDDFDGHTLPAEVGLSNKFENEYKIVPKQVVNALKVLYESANTAGLFDLHGNRSRMIRPIILSTASSITDEASEAATNRDQAQESQESATNELRRGGGGGGSDNAGDADAPGFGRATVHPALMGLIQNLPAIGSRLGPKRRAALIDAFKSTINFIYPEDEEDVTIPAT